jgi:hypothetical protein
VRHFAPLPPAGKGLVLSLLLAACTRHNHPEPSSPPLVIGNAHKWRAFLRDQTSFQHNLRTSINMFYIVHWDSEQLRPRDLTWPTPTTINRLLPLILATMRLIRLNPIAGNQLAFVPQSLGRVIYQPMVILDTHWSLKVLLLLKKMIKNAFLIFLVFLKLFSPSFFPPVYLE